MNQARLKLALVNRFLLDTDHVIQLDREDQERRVYLDSGMQVKSYEPLYLKHFEETLHMAHCIATQYRKEKDSI